MNDLPRLPSDIRMTVSNRFEDLAPHAPTADIILYADGNGDLLARILHLAPRARWIHCLWTGVESILKPELLKHPAPLSNGRGVFRWPLADWAVGVMLFFSFDFRRVLQQQDQKLWKPFVSKTLEGLTLGIVGYGSIGQACATRARVFGMKIGAMRRQTDRLTGDPLIDRSYSREQLKDLMADSDYVLAATPLTPQTRGMIGEAEIGAMKPSAVLINIGRGPVVDERALVRALQSHAIRGAALDVFDTEPLPAEHPFWSMPQVFLSPHTADRVEGFLKPAWETFLENLNRFRNGQTLLNVVDKQAGY